LVIVVAAHSLITVTVVAVASKKRKRKIPGQADCA